MSKSDTPQHAPQTAAPTISPAPSRLLQRQSTGSGLAAPQRTTTAGVPTVVGEVLRAPGQPLDPATRAQLEPRFGHDFSQVQVHTDARAAQSAAAVQAQAYTVGQHIVFGAGRYAPHTPKGQGLIRHELVHTIQQGSIALPSLDSLQVSQPGDRSEQQADQVVSAVLSAQTLGRIASTPAQIARQAAVEEMVEPAPAGEINPVPDPRKIPIPKVPPASTPLFGDPRVAAFAEQLAAWAIQHSSRPDGRTLTAGQAEDLTVAGLAKDFQRAMEIAPKSEKFGDKGRSIEDFQMGWMIGQRNKALFYTTHQPASKLQKFIAPKTAAQSSDLPEHFLPGWLAEKEQEKPGTVPKIAPLLVRFLNKLAGRYPRFTAANRPAHGGGSWAGKGYSLDLMLPARALAKSDDDAAGFYVRNEAVKFLRIVDDVINDLGAQSQVYYNDFAVAEEVNKQAKVINVDFKGNIKEGSSKFNWHGPNPLGNLHFHLDIIPRSGGTSGEDDGVE